MLSGPSGTLVAGGSRTEFSEVAAARHALRSGAAPLVLGALPLTSNGPAALRVRPPPSTGPTGCRSGRTLPHRPIHAATPCRRARCTEERVAEAVRRLRAADSPLQKVVLARALRLVADTAWDARSVLRRLAAADPAATVYLADLSAGRCRPPGSLAGGRQPGTARCARG